jgi:repressor LexA
MLGKIAAGQPIFAEEQFETYVEADSKINADFCLKVQGDSMVNARINNNDIVFIKQQSDINDGEIAVILIDNEATLKRVYKKENEIILVSENPAYKPMVFKNEELFNVRILGKAIAFQSKIV